MSNNLVRYYHDVEKKIQKQKQDTQTQIQTSRQNAGLEEEDDIFEISPGRFVKRLTTFMHVFTNSKTPRSEIERVRIVAVSPEWIRKVSVCEIVNNIPQGKNNLGKREGTLEDPRLGPRDRSTPCPTCFKNIEQCPGHRGYISLPLPSYNILFMDTLIQILRCVCFFCSRPLLQPSDPRYYKLGQHFHQMKRLSEQANISKTIEYCGGKPSPSDTLTLNADGKFSLNLENGCHNRQPLYYLKKKNKLMIIVHRRPPPNKKKPTKNSKKSKRKAEIREIKSPESPVESSSPIETEGETEIETETETEAEADAEADAEVEDEMEEDLGEDLGEEDADADYDLNQVEDQKEDQMEEEEEETEEEDRRDDPPLTTSSPPPAFITPLVTPNFSSKAFDIRLFFDSNPSLRKNLEWSKLEFLLPTANSLHDIIPRLVPSIQSESYPLHSETILPLFSSPSLPSSKRKFVYYTKEEDNDRRIPFWPSDALDILLRIKDEDLHLLGLTPASRPDWLIWQDFPVSPPSIRTVGATSADPNAKARTNSDRTRQLNKVVTCVRTMKNRMKRVETKLKEVMDLLKDSIDAGDQIRAPPSAGATSKVIERGKQQKDVSLESAIVKFYEAYMAMMMMITQFIDSDAKHIPFGTQKPYKGVTTQMKRKDGLVRSKVSCKRVNFCGRSVIVAGDVGLDVNEIGLPLIQCMKLTKPVRVNKYNINKLRQRILMGPDRHPGATSIVKPDGIIIDLSTAGKLRLHQLKYGDIVHCHLEDGDIVLTNRQPSLHAPSIMAHYVRVLPPFLTPTMPMYAIMLPLPVTPAYNADFDGDEMNLHVPQTEAAQAEAQCLMMVQMMITTRACIGPVQDAVLAAHRLSAPNCFFSREEIMQLLMQCKYLDFWITNKHPNQSLPVPAIATRDPLTKKWRYLWTGKQVVSFLLPPHFYFQNRSELTAVEVAQSQSTKEKTKEKKFDLDFASLEKYDDPALCLVTNGEFLLGRLRKSNFGTHSESMIQKCCLDFGSDYTMKFLSDFQRIVAQLWMEKGFSIGIEHEQTHVREQTRSFISHGLKLIETLALKTRWEGEDEQWKKQIQFVLSTLWKLQTKLEVPENIWAQWDTILRLFYRQAPIFQKQFLNLLLDKITDVTGKRYLVNISSQAGSHMQEMVASNTKASTVHVMQMTGILGLSRVQGRSVPRNYARDRASPHFTCRNYHPSSFGFIQNGYETGLTPLEMYFNALQGRESLVNVVSQTPQLGYAQRRFLRNFEDISIAYDYTVRDPTGIVEFLSGDDGFSSCHVEKQKYFCISWDRKQITQYFFASIETWFPLVTEEVQLECTTKQEELKHLLKEEVDQILSDVVQIRKMKVFFHATPPLDQNIVTALHFQRILQIHRSQMLERLEKDHVCFQTRKNDLSPLIIIQGVKDFKQFVCGHIQYRSSMLSFFALLHIHVCVKKILLDYQLDKKQFELFLKDIEGKYLNALSVPGYPNGTNASQVIGQNITQTSFDGPKIKASAGNAVQGGIQRINECTTATKKIKEPSMEIYLMKHYQVPEKIRELMQQMKMITLGQVVKSCYLLYDPLPNQKQIPLSAAAAAAAAVAAAAALCAPALSPETTKESDEREIQFHQVFAKEDEFLLKFSLPLLCLQENSRSRAQYNNYSSYVVRLELNREKLLELGKNIWDVVNKIQKVLGGKHLWIVSPVFASKWIIRIRMNRKAPEFSKRVKVKVTARTEKQTIQCLVDILLTKITFNGLNGIRDVVVHETEQVRWNPETLQIIKEKEFYLVTDGTNFQHVLNLKGIDHRRSISNDIHEVNSVLGIDAACNVLLREISKVLDNSKVYIDSHHLHVLKASIGKGGYFERCNRFGFGRNRKRGWMKRVSFEELVRNLKESALVGEIDYLQDNASCTMIGKHVPLGTHGPFEIFEDLQLSAKFLSEVKPQIRSELLPPLTKPELEGIIPILVPPSTPLQAWSQAGLTDDKKKMDFRWRRYEMGRERHVPDYSFFLKNIPSLENLNLGAGIRDASPALPALPGGSKMMMLPPVPLFHKVTGSTLPSKKRSKEETLELLNPLKPWREPILQSNIRKKCQAFLFKQKKPKIVPLTKKRKKK